MNPGDPHVSATTIMDRLYDTTYPTIHHPALADLEQIFRLDSFLGMKDKLVICSMSSVCSPQELANGLFIYDALLDLSRGELRLIGKLW
jgi:hypothetical protein